MALAAEARSGTGGASSRIGFQPPEEDPSCLENGEKGKQGTRGEKIGGVGTERAEALGWNEKPQVQVSGNHVTLRGRGGSSVFQALNTGCENPPFTGHCCNWGILRTTQPMEDVFHLIGP